MNPLLKILKNLVVDLRHENRGWALLGGLAVSVHAERRFTRYIDVGVAVSSDRDAEQLIHALRQCGYRVQATVEQEAVGRLATARLSPPRGSSEGVLVDLLFASSGIEAEIVRAAEPIKVFKGLVIPVVRPGHLVALKILARDDRRRPQDLLDLRALLPRLGKIEKRRAESAMRLITKRGFHRGRDLLGAWRKLLVEQAAEGDAAGT